MPNRRFYANLALLVIVFFSLVFVALPYVAAYQDHDSTDLYTQSIFADPAERK